MPAMRVAPYKNITAPEDAPQIFKDMWNIPIQFRIL